MTISNDPRLEELKHWLREGAGIEFSGIEPASADASFRRYFRISIEGTSLIAMDAPPPQEDCRPFVVVAEAMGQIGLNVPRIVAKDLERGYLLLNDLGNEQYLDQLGADTVDELYGDAMNALFQLHTRCKELTLELPAFDHAMLWREMELFRDWFLVKHLGIELNENQQDLLSKVFESLAQSALEQPQSWVHRDYHSRNLMLTQKNNPGILDFQDAVVGAISYDLVSLLRDCYIDWPLDRVEEWVDDYRLRLFKHHIIPDVSSEKFMRWFDWMGAQRHLKAIGIFSRLNYRDGKPGYLGDIPRTLNYVIQVSSSYKELQPLHEFIQQHVVPCFDFATGQKK